MATVSAQVIINGALRLLGVINPEDSASPTANQTANALEALNQLLLSWSGKRFVVPNLITETFNLVASQASYTWATGANFNSQRPLEVMGGYVHDTSSGIDFALDVKDQAWYDSVGLKTIGTIPESIFYNALYPTGTIYFYPVPDKVYSVTLDSQKALVEIATAATAINM